jgi:hypothetical protein
VHQTLRSIQRSYRASRVSTAAPAVESSSLELIDGVGRVHGSVFLVKVVLPRRDGRVSPRVGRTAVEPIRVRIVSPDVHRSITSRRTSVVERDRHRDIHITERSQELLLVVKVLGVWLGEAGVLVLGLDEDDGPAVGDLVFGDNFADLGDVVLPCVRVR